LIVRINVTTPRWKKRKGQRHTHRRSSRQEQSQPQFETRAITVVNPTVVSVHGERPPEKKSHFLIRGARGFWAFVVSISVIVSLIAGYLALVPRITVIPTTEVNSDFPFSSPFTVENAGYLPVYSMSFDAVIVRYADSRPSSVSDIGLQSTNTVAELDGGQQNTIPVAPFVPFPGSVPPYKELIIQFTAHFKPAFYWKYVDRTFAFSLITKSNGEQVWAPVKISYAGTRTYFHQ
jgi:hypothetical protein